MEYYLNKGKLLKRIDAMLSKTCDENGETVPNEWYESLRKLVEQEQPADVVECSKYKQVLKNLDYNVDLVRNTIKQELESI